MVAITVMLMSCPNRCMSEVLTGLMSIRMTDTDNDLLLQAYRKIQIWTSTLMS